MSTVIKIENLGKCYHIRPQAGYVNLKEVLASQLLRLTSRKSSASPYRDLWALRDVTIEINSGELIGLVGLNGSGKSTLLKLLSEVTKPTTGSIKLWGRIGSLLEVGTGFHPELTGKENIYLSGSILGMSWKEIASKYDEIVAFSEIAQHLDMPVKRYSSGMYMRLAFSVAAHLDPDILLIDEALAVGDLNFRRKCMAKMQSFVKSGATVIFVSHNMGLLAENCQRCLFLEKGRLIADGPAVSIIQRYLKSTASSSEISFPEDSSSSFLSHVKINQGRPAVYSQAFNLEVGLRKMSPGQRYSLGFGFSSLDGNRILICEGEGLLKASTPDFKVSGEVRALPITPGIYLLDLMLRDENHILLDQRLSCAQIEVSDGAKKSRAFTGDVSGVLMNSTWEES